jgi:hypothetical protein
LVFVFAFAQGIREREHAFVKRNLLIFCELIQRSIETGAPAIDKPCSNLDGGRGERQGNTAAISLACFPNDQPPGD